MKKVKHSKIKNTGILFELLTKQITSDILNDIKSAKIEYEDFLKRFPKHELSPSVQFEIDYKGIV